MTYGCQPEGVVCLLGVTSADSSHWTRPLDCVGSVCEHFNAFIGKIIWLVFTVVINATLAASAFSIQIVSSEFNLDSCPLKLFFYHWFKPLYMESKGYKVMPTHLLFCLHGHKFMVARDGKLNSTSLILLKVHILVLCFWDSTGKRGNDNVFQNRKHRQTSIIYTKGEVFKSIQNRTEKMRIGEKIYWLSGKDKCGVEK